MTLMAMVFPMFSGNIKPSIILQCGTCNALLMDYLFLLHVAKCFTAEQRGTIVLGAPQLSIRSPSHHMLQKELCLLMILIGMANQIFYYKLLVLAEGQKYGMEVMMERKELLIPIPILTNTSFQGVLLFL